MFPKAQREHAGKGVAPPLCLEGGIAKIERRDGDECITGMHECITGVSRGRILEKCRGGLPVNRIG